MSVFRFQPIDFQCECPASPCAHSSSDWIATRANQLWDARIKSQEKKAKRMVVVEQWMLNLLLAMQTAILIKLVWK